MTSAKLYAFNLGMALKLAKEVEAEFKAIRDLEIHVDEMHRNRLNIWIAFEETLKKLSDYDVCHITFCVTGKLFGTGPKPKRPNAIAYLREVLKP